MVELCPLRQRAEKGGRGFFWVGAGVILLLGIGNSAAIWEHDISSLGGGRGLSDELVCWGAG